MLICLPWKGSGGGVVYGCGVWRVKSWVKNVPNTNEYIAIFLIKWGWSPLTYLPLVFIISEKSIILFYWTPYRGIEMSCCIWDEKDSETTIEPLIGGLIRYITVYNPCTPFHYWTPYRGIDKTLRGWGIRNEQWAMSNYLSRLNRGSRSAFN